MLSQDNKVFCLRKVDGILELPTDYLLENERVSSEVERVVEVKLGFCVGIVKEDLKYYHARFAATETGKPIIEMYTVSRYLSGKPVLSDEQYTWVSLDAVDELQLTVETRRIMYKLISNTDKVAGIILNQKGASVILAARALIKNSEGKYLFIKRSDDDVYSGKWELPGGKLERLEVLETHLKREVLEETALSVDIIKNNAFTFTNVVAEGVYKGVTFLNITAICKLVGGVIKLSPEHSGYQWVNREEAANLDLTAYIRPVVNELLLAE